MFDKQAARELNDKLLKWCSEQNPEEMPVRAVDVRVFDDFANRIGAALDYIEELEKERGRLEDENAELRDDLAAERDRCASLALQSEAARRIPALEKERERLRGVLATYADRENWYDDSVEGDKWCIVDERGWEPAQRALEE